MTFSRLFCSTAIAAIAVPTSIMAQDETSASDNEIVVVAERLPGQVETDVPPVLELNEADIAAYGAGSISDLLAAIEPQTESSRGRSGGRPIFLINGVRVGSFREFRSYPPEAIRKVEVLPEEVAQKFGFAADRRVVNFILQENFSALTLEAEYEQPASGGYWKNEQEATLLKITKGGRLNFNIEREDTSALTEADRGIIQTTGSIPDVATDPDPAAFRTLVSDSEQYEATANFAKAFLESGSSISLNATVERNDSLSLSGLDSVLLTDPLGNNALRTFNADDPLARRSRTDSLSTSGSYNRPIGSFVLTATVDASLTDNRSQIDRRADTSQLIADAAAGLLAIDGALPMLADAGFDVSESTTYSASSKATLRGSPLFLPGGEVSTTFDIGYDWTRIESEDSRGGSAVQLTRGNLSGGLTVSVPITSRRENFLDAIGSITLTGQLAVNNYSDFGTLTRFTGGLNWEPVDGLNLQATHVRREVPPSLSQLGDPQITSFNVPTFDFVNNETVLATVTSGGNPNLLAETQSDWSFAANWRLPFFSNARFRVDYSRNRSDNVSSSFPFLTPEIEAAFPGRITRDAGGTLIAIDRRPVDYFETRSERLSFGLNFRGSIGKAPERRGPPQGAGEGNGTGNDGSRADAAQNSPGPRRAQGQRGERGERGGRGERGEGGRRGPPSAERREQFMALRERLCADDGEAFLTRFADAVDAGEEPESLPGFDAERAQRFLQRFRNDDGTLDRQRLTGFRERICSADPNVGPGSRPGTRPSTGSGTGSRGEGSGQQPAPQSGQQAASGGGRGGGGAAARFIGGRGGDSRARYFINLTHNIELNREILIAAGGPQLDLLDGDSLSTFGTPTHTSRIEAGLFKNGLGMRLSGRYTGSARIDGTGAPGSTDLSIDDLATVDLRLFADLGQVLKKDDGLFKNLRASFRINNLFDGRRRVTDSNGDTPISFQPLLIDPTGRYVGIQLRKLF